MAKTTWDDVAANVCDAREWEGFKGGEQHGRSYLYINCPFCSTRIKAFIWSLCGCGKRCTCCGAMFGSDGTAYKKK